MSRKIENFYVSKEDNSIQIADYKGGLMAYFRLDEKTPDNFDKAKYLIEIRATKNHKELAEYIRDNVDEEEIKEQQLCHITAVFNTKNHKQKLIDFFVM